MKPATYSKPQYAARTLAKLRAKHPLVTFEVVYSTHWTVPFTYVIEATTKDGRTCLVGKPNRRLGFPYLRRVA